MLNLVNVLAGFETVFWHRIFKNNLKFDNLFIKELILNCQLHFMMGIKLESIKYFKLLLQTSAFKIVASNRKMEANC